jgi:predicted RNA-binding protein with PIN domain
MKSIATQALLLVDGYNIIGAWSNLQRIRDRHGLESARRDLISIVTDYTAYQGLKTEIIFDSHLQKTPLQKEQFSPQVSVYYTAFSQTADSYIERVCASFSRAHPATIPRIIVATSDRAQRLTAIGYGAEWYSAEKFKAEVETITSQVKNKKRPHSNSKGRFLFNHLDPQTQATLFQWRQGKY